ncbi:unnamed protein product [Paramecium octaurelia]|uniref:Uncharacterized protein n=1 Tax=Paramecium octaurelia TaxID=43137 RepID=A0A8S1VNW1_PAROT|nr:unnamed protein product [Paramecium octaurelia]
MQFELQYKIIARQSKFITILTFPNIRTLGIEFQRILGMQSEHKCYSIIQNLKRRYQLDFDSVQSFLQTHLFCFKSILHWTQILQPAYPIHKQ